MKEDKLLYKEETYKIRGLLFDVHNELGRYCNEYQYGDAFEHRLKEQRIPYEREKVLPSHFVGEKKYRNRVDFIVYNVIVVEFKVVPVLNPDHYEQCMRYLTALNFDLALLVNFRPKFLHVKRILNHEKYNCLEQSSGKSGLSGYLN